jgi:hypothetical protein
MKIGLAASLLVSSLLLTFCVTPAKAADYPKAPITIKLEGAKMAPVSFSHGSHVEKQKIDCAKCHHKDAQDPKACTVCHGKDAKDSRPTIKDALHSTCQNCHKEGAAKGEKGPTKCMECHKK